MTLLARVQRELPAGACDCLQGGGVVLLPRAVAMGYPGLRRGPLGPPADHLDCWVVSIWKVPGPGKARCPCWALFAWADACGSPGGGGHAGPPSLRACPARALTLLQLLLVVCFGLGGHDLEKGLENTSQVAGVVGLQLVGHPWGRMAEGGVRPTSSLGGGKKRLPNPRDNSSCRSKSSGGKGHQGRGDPGSPPGRRFLSFAQLYLGSRPPH